MWQAARQPQAVALSFCYALRHLEGSSMASAWAPAWDHRPRGFSSGNTGARALARRNVQESPVPGIPMLAPPLAEPGEVLRTAQQWQKSPVLPRGARRRRRRRKGCPPATPGNSLHPAPPPGPWPRWPPEGGRGPPLTPPASHSFGTKFLWEHVQLTFSSSEIAGQMAQWKTRFSSLARVAAAIAGGQKHRRRSQGTFLLPHPGAAAGVAPTRATEPSAGSDE